jgi:Glycosyl transferase family 2
VIATLRWSSGRNSLCSRRVRLVMTLKVRDEADVLEANLRYHACLGVDHFIATDSGSQDGSLEILDRWRAAGRLTLITEPPEDFNSKAQEWVTRMARLAATDLEADWVIHNDADEFWWPLAGGPLHDALGSVSDTAGVVVAPRSDFVARPDRPGSFTERLVFRERRSLIPPKLAHRARADIVVLNRGAHAVDIAAAATGKAAYSDGRAVLRPVRRRPLVVDDPLAWAPEFPIHVLHFPVRSEAQFRHRVEGALKGGFDHQGMIRELRERFESEGVAGLYADLLLSDDQIEAALRDGRLVRDTRVRDFLATCPDPLVTTGTLPAPLHRPPADVEQDIAQVKTDALAALARMQRSLFAQARNAQARQRVLRQRLDEERARNRDTGPKRARIPRLGRLARRRAR